MIFHYISSTLKHQYTPHTYTHRVTHTWTHQNRHTHTHTHTQTHTHTHTHKKTQTHTYTGKSFSEPYQPLSLCTLQYIPLQPNNKLIAFYESSCLFDR